MGPVRRDLRVAGRCPAGLAVRRGVQGLARGTDPDRAGTGVDGAGHPAGAGRGDPGGRSAAADGLRGGRRVGRLGGLRGALVRGDQMARGSNRTRSVAVNPMMKYTLARIGLFVACAAVLLAIPFPLNLFIKLGIALLVSALLSLLLLRKMRDDVAAQLAGAVERRGGEKQKRRAARAGGGTDEKGGDKKGASPPRAGHPRSPPGGAPPPPPPRTA